MNERIRKNLIAITNKQLSHKKKNSKAVGQKVCMGCDWGCSNAGGHR